MRRRLEPLNADLTPLIDVVFLLLVFFLVSSVFKKEELALLLNLPRTEHYQETIEKEEIGIELAQEGLALNGKNVTFETLDSTLELVQNKQRPILVRIDEEVPYKRVTQLFDLLQKHDLNNLLLVSKNEQGTLK